MQEKREKANTCTVCGKPIEQDAKNKIRKYCSAACKQKAYRLKKKAESEPLMATLPQAKK